MKLVIVTQIKENYGAHTWDGKGECPQYWKFKGGETYIVEDFQFESSEQAKAVVDSLETHITQSNEYFQEWIINWSVESDDFVSDYENSQIEYGDISPYYFDMRLTLNGFKIKRFIGMDGLFYETKWDMNNDHKAVHVDKVVQPEDFLSADFIAKLKGNTEAEEDLPGWVSPNSASIVGLTRKNA